MAVEDDFDTTPSPDATSTQILKDIGVLDVGGTPTEIIKLFGGKPKYMQALTELEQALYQAA